MQKILFVCTGNICRSPTAEGVLRHKLAEAGIEAQVDSAGTHGYHVGEAPDPRSIEAARKRGIDISDIRARKLQSKDYHNFDLILGLDSEHMEILTHTAPDNATATTALFMEYAGFGKQDVADPYYGGSSGFETVLDQLERGADALIEKLRGTDGK